MAHRIKDLDPPKGEHHGAWDIEVVSEPITTGCEDVDTALGRSGDEAGRHEWDLVVGMTELPLRDDGKLVDGVAALATGAIATFNSTVWLLAGSLSPWRLVIATIAWIALVVAWIVIDGELWDRPDDHSSEARERSRVYNTSTEPPT